MRHLLEYAVGWGVLRTLGLLPRPASRRLAAALFQLVYWLTPRLRRIAEQNLRMALPHLTTAERRETCRGVYGSLARLLAECSHFPRLTAANVSQVVCYEGLEHYEAARAQEKGVLLLTAHLGAWELGAFAHALRGYPLHIVYRSLDNPRLNGLVNRYRTLSGNRLIEKKDAARSILAALARKETVGILADQNTLPEEGVFVNFFGVPACMTAGIARFALHTGAPVVPAFCVWDDRAGKFRIIFDRAVKMVPGGDSEQDVQQATQQMASAIERRVRQYPDQWLWIHRRWKTRPPGELPLYS
ncbi:MAG: hypothetical protein A3H27_06430 [Acidobacteria bacterium RIFCSPLOWO2_02_FULL_59_13]|nr:MAG: hypothetical protein A3H27_06430 [Acidobacteria bacterium RIFCSPLOWO2_02_FULL_59_13]